MDNEDEETSKLTNPPVQDEDDLMKVTIATETTITTTSTVTDSHEAVQEKAEPQCQPETVAELCESQLPPEEQSLGEGKKIEEEEILRKSESVAEVDESKLGGGADESRDSAPVVSEVVGEEDGDVSNAEDVANGGDLVVPEPVVGGGEGEGEKVNVIGEGEREVADGVEETEGKARADDVAEEKEEKVDVAEENEIFGIQKGDVVAVEAQTESETKVDIKAQVEEIVGEKKGDDVAAEAQMVDDVMEETGIVEDMIDERTEMAGDRVVAGDANVVDVVEETETADETKVVDVAEEMTGTVDETKVAVETDGRTEMAENTEIAGETKVVDVAEDKEMAKEINLSSAEVKKVADVTQTTVAAAADETEVGDVAEETEMQEEETEFTDLTGGETEVEEEMEKATDETEMLEATETEEMEMGDVGEEFKDSGTGIGDEMEKAEAADEMEAGENVEELSKMVGGKRKRVGKNSKSPGKALLRKKSEEDVCFICFDGGNLVICDRRRHYQCLSQYSAISFGVPKGISSFMR